MFINTYINHRFNELKTHKVKHMIFISIIINLNKVVIFQNLVVFWEMGDGRLIQ